MSSFLTYLFVFSTLLSFSCKSFRWILYLFVPLTYLPTSFSAKIPIQEYVLTYALLSPLLMNILFLASTSEFELLPILLFIGGKNFLTPLPFSLSTSLLGISLRWQISILQGLPTSCWYVPSNRHFASYCLLQHYRW